MAKSSDRLVHERIEDWQRRLIDLSYRNRLIKYKTTVATTIEIESPSLDRLLEDPSRATPWRFYFPPEDEEEGNGVESDATLFVEQLVLRSDRRSDRGPRA